MARKTRFRIVSGVRIESLVTPHQNAVAYLGPLTKRTLSDRATAPAQSVRARTGTDLRFKAYCVRGEGLSRVVQLVVLHFFQDSSTVSVYEPHTHNSGRRQVRIGSKQTWF